ncbi:DUF1549 domain-containing protein [Stieleria varia]|uniref:Cytochrome c domain-containing protein n=1 Tax=Stieleria varia TaxID=2528005 RepID=A0A5C5ZWW6_9BACT|nr:DUF1549 domain-containing protein [Stieleria varia]TWT91518.1 hypothetical protein Pla52n_66090 [Stieleria varia]
MPTSPIPFCSVTLIACLFATTLVAGDTISTPDDAVAQVNRFIADGWTQHEIQPAGKCNDLEFVRRVHLDLVGRVPTQTEVENFVADGRDDKRSALVDVLLASEDHVQHFADVFDTLLMGRTEERKYSRRVDTGWRAYLETVFRDDRAWNEVAAEILLARPNDQDRKGSVWFLYERKDNHQAIAEAVAPAFFGVRIECAQCHDHMSADEIEQAHYWGLVAFFNRGKNTDSKRGPAIAESAIGGFSDFADIHGSSSPNLLKFLGAETVDEPRPAADAKQEDSDELYLASTVDGAPRIPKFSRRERFVEEVLNDHPNLARAMVNRLWAIVMGRGIVHPYDEMDSTHLPSHPELLDWLAKDFAENGYAIRRMVRMMVLSEAYQLQSLRPQGVDDPASFAWYLERPLTGEQLARSIQLVARGSFQNDAGLVGQFRQQIGDVLPDETVVGVDDALFYSNGSGLAEYLAASNEDQHLIHRVCEMSSNADRVDALFQAAYCRSPDDDEREAVVSFLEERSDSLPVALTHVLWSLITAAEFQFNH